MLAQRLKKSLPVPIVDRRPNTIYQTKVIAKWWTLYLFYVKKSLERSIYEKILQDFSEKKFDLFDFKADGNNKWNIKAKSSEKL